MPSRMRGGSGIIAAVRFDGATVAVTGASEGIGLATARALAAEGARVVLMARSEARLQELAEEIGRDALPVVCDVADEQSVERAFDAIEADAGDLTHLVNCAGVVEPGLLHEMSLETWEQTFAVNTRGTFLVTRRALRGMIGKGRGAIVNVSSISGVIGPTKFPGYTAYCASKAAVIAMTEVLALEVAEHGIRVNAISPGSVDTAMWARVSGGSPAEMTPGELAKSIMFLLSDDARPFNGRNLDVWA